MLVLPALRPARADIYRWVDEQGVSHFTDDESAIPREERGKAKMIIKEGPKRPSPPPAPPAGESAPAARPAGGPPPDDAGAAGTGRDRLRLEAEQLKAKIEAKESLVRAVDEKQSLALHPLGNRIVDPADMDLYLKYKDELPNDRERLRLLEEQLR
jgi:hypothetical protein